MDDTEYLLASPKNAARLKEAVGKMPGRMGRPELPPEHRTRPRTIWMTDAEWVKVKAAPKGWVRGLVQRAKVPA